MAQLIQQLRRQLGDLRQRLPAEPIDRYVAVYDDNIMSLNDYLETRILEQVVHLDDLARSLDLEPWACSSGAQALAIGCGAEIGERRKGATEMIRILFRNEVPLLSVI